MLVVMALVPTALTSAFLKEKTGAEFLPVNP
jgi:hypothetical protein